ncbi:hypothetical protein SDC9_155069 [bioreactor metagenome]|uniref:Uncharacterized protein n=1 Tax=bioreactor metagenome TaxID=1076179 RepID=A0A645F0S5_9ZZZZ
MRSTSQGAAPVGSGRMPSTTSPVAASRQCSRNQVSVRQARSSRPRRAIRIAIGPLAGTLRKTSPTRQGMPPPSGRSSQPPSSRATIRSTASTRRPAAPWSPPRAPGRPGTPCAPRTPRFRTPRFRTPRFRTTCRSRARPRAGTTMPCSRSIRSSARPSQALSS